MTDFIRIPSNPVPEGGRIAAMKTADDASLRYAIFPKENARGTIVLMAGRSEFIEKYFEVIEDLQARGFAVATMDWRGQGLSSRLLPVSEKGHINDFGAYVADLRTFTEDIVVKELPGPYLLMTHSMGGLPALLLMTSGYERFEGAVLCAPMTRFYASAGKRAFVSALANIACRIGASRQSVAGVEEHSLEFEGNNLTSDQPRHERFKDLQAAAPNAAIRAPTYGWVKAAIDGVEEIHRPERLAKLEKPVRIISAERDDLVDASDHALLASMSPQIDLVTIKGALHEILMERDQFRSEFWAGFDEFVDKLIPNRT